MVGWLIGHFGRCIDLLPNLVYKKQKQLLYNMGSAILLTETWGCVEHGLGIVRKINRVREARITSW